MSLTGIHPASTDSVSPYPLRSAHLRMNLPPVLLAYSQLNSAVLAPPTCRLPVGEGAKRTRTCHPARQPMVVAFSGKLNAARACCYAALACCNA